MIAKEWLEDIKERFIKYQTDYNLNGEDVEWLINRVEELEKQRNERTQLLNAEVARNVRYKKVLDELWKTAKRALEDEE